MDPRPKTKRLSLLLLVLAASLLLFIPPAHAQPTVNHTEGDVGSTNPVQAVSSGTFTTTLGDVIVLGVGWATTTAGDHTLDHVSSVVCSADCGAWGRVASHNGTCPCGGNNAPYQVEIWTEKSTGTGSITLTATMNAVPTTNVMGIDLADITGIGTATSAKGLNRCDNSAAGCAATNAVALNSSVTAGSNDVLFAALTGRGCVITSGGASFTLIQQSGQTACVNTGQVAVGLASSTFPFTQTGGGGGNWAEVAAVFAPATITQVVTCSFSNQAIVSGAASTTITATGAGVSPSSFTCPGSVTFTANPSQTLTLAGPADSTATRYRLSWTSETTCSSGTCAARTLAVFFECSVLVQVQDASNGAWGGGMSIPVKGTAAGNATTFVNFSPVSGSSAQLSSTIWPDCSTSYNLPASVTDSTNNLWNAQQTTILTENQGGSTRTIPYLTTYGLAALNPGEAGSPFPRSGASAAPSLPNPITNPIGFLAALANLTVYEISQNIPLFLLLLLLAVVTTYLYVKSRYQKGARA